MSASFQVDAAGPYVSIQDAGRPGHMRFGVPPSGPMDRFSFDVLSTLLGDSTNLDSASFNAIEVSVAGLRLTCTQGAVTAALTGGHFEVDIDQIAQPPWSVFTLETGATLSIRGGAAGSWGYLGFAGALDAPQWLGSCSTHLYSGLCGQPLRAGDRLHVRHTRVHHDLAAALPMPSFTQHSGAVRVVTGPQEHCFTPQAKDTLIEQPFHVSSKYDRMGMRLEGPPLATTQALNLPSEPLVRGSVQVNGDGEASVLMADHQTTGGYPKLATVISADQDALAQAQPGDAVFFSAVSVDEAIVIARRAHVLKQCYLDEIRRLR